MVEKWYKKSECAGKFWLDLSVYLVSVLPTFLLRIVIFFVTVFYYVVSKNNRLHIKEFYINLNTFLGYNRRYMVYKNFYHFGVAICDKIAAYKNKIPYNSLLIDNKEYFYDELLNKQKGQVLLMSYFGNVEVAKALSNKFEKLRVVAFVYQKNSQHFLNMIEKISQKKIERIFVDDIDMEKILALQNVVDSGGHIGIMGDRVDINGKNITIDFLGKSCSFPLGAFYIASILKCEMSSLWCEKINGAYHICLEKIGENIERKSLEKYVKKYVHSLEKHVANNPTQWFSFYDFWRQND